MSSAMHCASCIELKAERDALRGENSLYEDSLASYAQENAELRAENERLREALQAIVSDHEFTDATYGDRGKQYADTARAALAGKQPQEGE